MGGSIARGLAFSGIIPQSDITVCDPTEAVLNSIKSQYPQVNVSTNNADAVAQADIVVVAVKPWLLDGVMAALNGKFDFSRQILVSVVAGATLQHLASFAGEGCKSPAVLSLSHTAEPENIMPSASGCSATGCSSQWSISVEVACPQLRLPQPLPCGLYW